VTQVPLEQVVDHVKKLLRRGDTARAVPIVGDIVRQAGPAPLSRMMQGIMAIQFGQYDHAIQVLEQVSFELIGDDQRDATVALARARTLSGDPEGALITIEPVCEADDAPGSAHRAKAEALVAAGRADEARAHLQSLPGDVAEPHEIALAWAAVALEADRGDPVHEAAIEHLSTERERVGVPAGALADICLAYAELHARAGDDAAAATLFKRSISMNPTKADPRPYAQTVMKLINGWSGPALGRAQKLESNTDDRPVFVVGMPGGGPELVAALLGTHDGVRVVDHAEALTAMVGRHVVGKAGAEPVVLDPSKPGAKQLRDAAAGYLQRLGVDAEPGGDSPDRVVDPYPLNLHVLGLVAQMFPSAGSSSSGATPSTPASAACSGTATRGCSTPTSRAPPPSSPAGSDASRSTGSGSSRATTSPSGTSPSITPRSPRAGTRSPTSSTSSASTPRTPPAPTPSSPATSAPRGTRSGSSRGSASASPSSPTPSPWATSGRSDPPPRPTPLPVPSGSVYHPLFHRGGSER
jgi:tetratricopeptide (TPR) repeat protein